jgi:hypothetical protein
MPGFRNDDEEDDLYESVSAMADRMGLKDDKRATYIDDHMLQGGYTRVQSRESYAKVRQEEGEQGDGGNRWGFGARGETSGRRGAGRVRSGEDDSF